MFGKEPSLRQEFKDKLQAADGSRTAFMLRARGIIGDDFKALVRTTLTERTTQTNTETQAARRVLGRGQPQEAACGQTRPSTTHH